MGLALFLSSIPLVFFSFAEAGQHRPFSGSTACVRADCGLDPPLDAKIGLAIGLAMMVAGIVVVFVSHQGDREYWDDE